ncbi:DegT/DnrJ/EryC1/StrS family aminotransferase [Halomarina ordinaria]|uniref:DegT/DnrJ/EryC1/StrS family aminotransferase n=1 Tax=Halomarina ordinaria TaxID=3033939 RepID=A0ABD5U709_9EURY|nr:DegT/DnrJ/EryC1/StrS family aminotransferase [Halomarina sp. PSRA2]
MGRVPIAEPQIGREERERVAAVLESGMLADGPAVRAFEREFAAFCDAAHGVATSNGTTALHAALRALDVGEGSRVLTTPFSFVATANAARLVGARVGFVDIDPETYTIDPEALEACLRAGEEVTAVVAVHLYGLPAEMPRLLELAERYDFALVEDAAQAHGATVDGDPVGALGDVGCFSFYPTKNMTTGEGGMITTDRDDVAERAAAFVDHGRTSGYEHATVGHNFRMTSIAAAIGRVQLERLPGYTEARRRNAAVLTEALAGGPLDTPTVPAGRGHVFHQYTVRCDDRDALARFLDDRDIDARVYYPIPIHHQRPYRHVAASVPHADRAAETVLSLPVHPGVSTDTATRIAATVRAFVDAG